jgi:hypothetical protein
MVYRTDALGRASPQPQPADHLIFTIDAEGTFRSANAVTQQVFDYTEHELRGCAVLTLLRPNEDLKKTEPEMIEAHRSARERPGEWVDWHTWVRVREGRVWLRGKVMWDAYRNLWSEDCVVVNREAQLPMFEQIDQAAALLPPNGDTHWAQLEKWTFHAARHIPLGSLMLRGLDWQGSLPEMPTENGKRGPRKGPSDQACFLATLHSVFESIHGETGDERGDGYVTGRVTLARVTRGLGFGSGNTLAKRFKELDLARDGETPRQSLDRLEAECYGDHAFRLNERLSETG